MFLLRNKKKLSLNYPQNPLLSGALITQNSNFFLKYVGLLDLKGWDELKNETCE